MQEWLAKFGTYVPRYRPHFDKLRISTWLFQELNSLPASELVKENEAQAVLKEGLTVAKWKHYSVSAIRDFPPILGMFNPHLSEEMRRALHTHLTLIFDEYTQMELEEIRLLKAGALP